MHILITTINEKVSHEFETEKGRIIWKYLVEGKGEERGKWGNYNKISNNRRYLKFKKINMVAFVILLPKGNIYSNLNYYLDIIYFLWNKAIAKDTNIHVFKISRYFKIKRSCYEETDLIYSVLMVFQDWNYQNFYLQLKQKKRWKKTLWVAYQKDTLK